MTPEKKKNNDNAVYCHRYRQKIQLKRLQSKNFDKNVSYYTIVYACTDAAKVLHMLVRFFFSK
jgi:hypothetical protein